MSVQWNPWHGCKKISEGCLNCYVYRIDGGHGKESGTVRLNADFLLPLKQGKDGMKIKSGETVYTCFSSVGGCRYLAARCMENDENAAGSALCFFYKTNSSVK